MRVQILLALVAALVLVAVPLYLWRRPQPAGIPSADAATVGSAPVPVTTGVGALAGARVPGGVPQLVGPPGGPKLEISPVKTLKCQDPGPGRTPPERCDGVRFFEDGLQRAIQDAASCAPAQKNGFVASFVLEFHFGKRRTNLFFGKSTTLAKSKRKELLRCVEQAMAAPDWERIPHQHLKYTIHTVVTYPPIVAGEADVAPPSRPPSTKTSPKGGSPKLGSPRKPPAKPTVKKKSG